MSLRIGVSLIPEPVSEPRRAAEPTSTAVASTDPAPAVARRDRIEAALQEMRDYLSDQHPATDAEALQSLRQAFPGTPLADRIAAIQTRFFA